jgi:DNA-binding MarR family transcriptional regulator
MSTKHRPSPEDVAGRIDRMLQEMARFRTPEFLDVGITMAQAKVLHVVVASGEIHMSELVHTLGVSLSTVSGLVDKLVDHGYLTRHDDPADRRQVVVSPTPAGTALLERFRDLSGAQTRELLERLKPGDLEALDRGVRALHQAAIEHLTATVPSTVPAPAGGAATATARKDRA